MLQSLLNHNDLKACLCIYFNYCCLELLRWTTHTGLFPAKHVLPGMFGAMIPGFLCKAGSIAHLSFQVCLSAFSCYYFYLNGPILCVIASPSIIFSHLLNGPSSRFIQSSKLGR